MADKVDISALAKLARLEISAEDMEKLEKQIPDILKFVEQIQEVHGSAPAAAPALRNVMRDDIDATETGSYTEKILAAAPAREGDRIAVKQVISKGKKK